MWVDSQLGPYLSLRAVVAAVEAGTWITGIAHSTVLLALPLGGGEGDDGVGGCSHCAGETSIAAVQQDEVEAQSECKEERVLSRHCRAPPWRAWL